MILVDTSIWVDHLRSGDAELADLLTGAWVYMHPFVLGELACGNLRQRKEVLSLLQHLPSAAVASQEEALFALETHGWMGKGIGWVDVHLLASALLTDGCKLWTRDKRLRKVAADLKLEHISKTE